MTNKFKDIVTKIFNPSSKHTQVKMMNKNHKDDKIDQNTSIRVSAFHKKVIERIEKELKEMLELEEIAKENIKPMIQCEYITFTKINPENDDSDDMIIMQCFITNFLDIADYDHEHNTKLVKILHDCLEVIFIDTPSIKGGVMSCFLMGSKPVSCDAYISRSHSIGMEGKKYGYLSRF